MMPAAIEATKPGIPEAFRVSYVSEAFESLATRETMNIEDASSGGATPRFAVAETDVDITPVVHASSEPAESCRQAPRSPRDSESVDKSDRRAASSRPRAEGPAQPDTASVTKAALSRSGTKTARANSQRAAKTRLGWPEVVRALQGDETRSYVLGRFREAGFSADSFRLRPAREFLAGLFTAAEDRLELAQRGARREEERVQLRTVRRALEQGLGP